MNGTLEGRVAIVTGAAGGIGRELVSGLLGAGASVAALDIDAERLAALAARHGDAVSDRRLIVTSADIAGFGACEAAVAEARERLGAPDILVNNGALGMGVIRADHMTELVGIHEIEPEVWERFVAVNFSGAWHMTRAAVGGMLDRGWGRIFNVTTSFFTMLRGRFHPYGPAKAGLEAMAAGHAAEFAGHGVTVNVVVPGGPADTPMVPKESGLDRAALVRPSAMVPPVLWLCSEEGGAWTGHRYIAGNWDTTLDPATAAAGCRAPIAWPDLAQSPVWPGGKPPE